MFTLTTPKENVSYVRTYSSDWRCVQCSQCISNRFIVLVLVYVSMLHRMIDHWSKYVWLCSCNRFWHQHPKLDYDAFLCKIVDVSSYENFSYLLKRGDTSIFSALLRNIHGDREQGAELRCFLIFQTLILDWLTEVYVEWLD
jgi:hypothetical protein